MRVSPRLAVTSAMCIAGISAFTVWCGGCMKDSAANGDAGSTTGSTGSSMPAGFPYTPAGCDYQVAIPEVTESGMDDGKGAGKPSHVHVSIAGKSDASFAVNWRTGNDTTASQILYGTDQAAVKAATAASDKVKLARGHFLLYGSALDGATLTRVHETHVCGLGAGTGYFYKVGGPGAWSDVFEVTTSPAIGTSATWRFAVLGDSRDDPTTFAKIQQALAAVSPDLQIFTGDAVATGASQKTWDSWFEATTGDFAVQTLLARTPFMPVNGNHESLAINYAAQFALPQQLSPGENAQGEEWYSFDYANAHFIALNDTMPDIKVATSGSEADWLKADLAAVDRKKTPWVFVMHHRSLYSCGGAHGSALELRSGWQPIFDQYQVDMVFSGHDHLYERSKPMRGLDGTSGKVAQAGPNDTPVAGSGTLYLLAGGAGAPLYAAATTPCNHTHITESTRNYALVDITAGKIHVKSLRLDGSIIDEFEFTK